MAWPGMIDHDDNDGNDDGDNYDTWVQRAASVWTKFCLSQVVRYLCRFQKHKFQYQAKRA